MSASEQPAYVHIADLSAEVSIPKDGILSRSIYADERVKVVVFGFDAGQELSRHTASMPAIIHILQGEAEIALGADVLQAGPGTWIHMEANLTHRVSARTPTVMLLLLLKTTAGGETDANP
jgi:quercetin dioxygenase-like cupin family protein